MANTDAIYNQGDYCFVNEDGLRYIRNNDIKLSDMATTSPVFIESVLRDHEDEQDTVYTGFFVNDPNKEEIQLYHFEASTIPLVCEEVKLITTPMDVIYVDQLPYSFDEAQVKTDLIDNYFESKGQELGALVDRKQKAYGNAIQQTYDVIKVFMKPYQNEDSSYTIPESLLMHLLLQVRIIDKQNRIFNNPNGDFMSESPYGDMGGYSLLGQALSTKVEIWK